MDTEVFTETGQSVVVVQRGESVRITIDSRSALITRVQWDEIVEAMK